MSVIQPGVSEVTAQYIETHHATQMALPVKTANGYELVGAGGFHKVHEAALRIACSLIQANWQDPAIIAQRAVEIADAVLTECDEYEKADGIGTQS